MPTDEYVEEELHRNPLAMLYEAATARALEILAGVDPEDLPAYAAGRPHNDEDYITFLGMALQNEAKRMLEHV